MAFDSAMFSQACECIKSIEKHSRGAGEVHVLSLGLTRAEVEWLEQNRVGVRTNPGGFPTYPDAPPYAAAMTCRPWLRELFPGFELYMWIDADIRFAAPDAFEFYLQTAAANPQAIVIAQEVDPAYVFVRFPRIARKYHSAKLQRVRATFGPEAADALAYFNCFNAGVFALHRDSLIWEKYQANLSHAVKTAFDHMKEQDAMNLAIVQNEMQVCGAPTIMNWLCSISFPRFNREVSRWVRPTWPALPLSVLHLTNSNTLVPGRQDGISFYQLYRQEGLTD
jgi:lipopolysaccharide biosynthesis glycosyltransferase